MYFGRVDIELFAPDQPRLFTEFDHMLKESAKDDKAEALANPGQAGVIGEWFIEPIAQIPTDAEAILCETQKLAFRSRPLEEERWLEAEEHDRIDGGMPSGGVCVLDPIADEGEVGVPIEAAVEVVSGDQIFERDGNTIIHGAELERTKHGEASAREGNELLHTQSE